MRSNSAFSPFTFAALMALTFFGAKSEAAGLTCLDDRGIPAIVREDPRVEDVAIAAINPQGMPEIIVNRVYLKKYFGPNASPDIQTFLFFHECAHLQSATVRLQRKMQNDLENEIHADIWAMREMIKRGYPVGQFKIVFDAFSRIPGGDSAHLDGPQRVQMMRLALDQFIRKGL